MASWASQLCPSSRGKWFGLFWHLSRPLKTSLQSDSSSSARSFEERRKGEIPLASPPGRGTQVMAVKCSLRYRFTFFREVGRVEMM